jgi:hypothetical protein
MKTLGKNISAGNPNTIEMRAMEVLSMKMSYLMHSYPE